VTEARIMNADTKLEKLWIVIEGQREEIIQTLQELVRIPTEIGHEAKGQEFMQNLYADLGLVVTRFEPDHEKIHQHQEFSESGWDYEGRPNIIGILEGKPSSKSLVLNGHIDVVSPEPVTDWVHPPWEGEIVDGRLYGRGSCDMKCGLLANYFALMSLLIAGYKPKGTVMLQSVIEEESGGGGGTLASLLEGYTGDGLVIAESTNEKIIVAEVGVHYFRVRVTGKPAHAGQAHTGVNAIGKMNLLYQALVELDLMRAKENHYPLFELDSERSCHLNIGKYQAGDWPSTVPGWAEMECRISQIPGEETETVKNQVHQAINNTAQEDPWLRQHPPEITWFGLNADPWEQEVDHPFVRKFQACTEKVLKAETEIRGFTASSDVRFAKYVNMPALLFGARGGNAHAVDEYVEINSLMNCTKILASFILEWCDVER
jgi:acetylornithine deacetylase